MWIIKDWAGNTTHNNFFYSFDDAEDFLSNWLTMNDLDYDDNRGEYVIDRI